jgi:hypothetical protein
MSAMIAHHMTLRSILGPLVSKDPQMLRFLSFWNASRKARNGTARSFDELNQEVDSSLRSLPEVD